LQLAVFRQLRVDLFSAERGENDVRPAVVSCQGRESGEAERADRCHRKSRSRRRERVEIKKIDGAADQKKKQNEATDQGRAPALVMRLPLDEV
jgi:hypothetical protein